MEAIVKEKKIIFAMVGLPARGKSYISNKIVCYLSWLGFNVKLFNIGKYRRQNVGTKECKADFFNHDNKAAYESRMECARLALRDLTNFLKEEGGDIAVYDGTNTTSDRRQMVKDFLTREMGDHSLVWIESICNDESVIEENIRDTKLSNPDYEGVNAEEAIRDFKQRIEEYKKVYQELASETDGDEVSFIKLFNVNNRITINNITGYIESKIVSYLMNLHITPRTMYFVRCGESINNSENRMGGDTELSDRGKNFCFKLTNFFQDEFEFERVTPKTRVYTSTLKRAMHTSEAVEIGAKPVYLKALDELDVGVCDGMLMDEVPAKYPDEYKARNADKLKFRFPMGESYQDVINRVEPVIFAMERSKDPVIVVGHQAVLRVIYGYFTKQPLQKIPYLSIPHSTVIRLNPESYYSREKRYNLEITGSCYNFDTLF